MCYFSTECYPSFHLWKFYTYCLCFFAEQNGGLHNWQPPHQNGDVRRDRAVPSAEAGAVGGETVVDQVQGPAGVGCGSHPTEGEDNHS